MLENAIYSVISPEGCASILWRNIESVQQAAESLMHAQLAGEKIAGLDGHPSQKIAKIEETNRHTIKDILEVYEVESCFDKNFHHPIFQTPQPFYLIPCYLNKLALRHVPEGIGLTPFA